MKNHRKALLLAVAVLVASCSDTSPPTSPSESASRAPGKKPGPPPGATVTELGLSGAKSDSRAEDIDDQGRIVGSRGPWTGKLRAFLWTPTSPRATTGSAMDLGDLGGGAAQARGINASGEVVGSSTTSSGRSNPFLWESGRIHGLGAPADWDFVEAMDVNDGTPRRVVGGPASPIDRAVVWTVSGSGTSFSVTGREVLPGLSSSGSFAFALNDAGVVVGYSNTAAGTNLPAVWSNPPTWSVNGLSLLETNASGGVAYDINAAGKIVGLNRSTASGCSSRAVVWMSPTDPAFALPTLSSGTCSEAWAINDAGQISGVSINGSGALRAVLWQPSGTGYSVSDLGALSGTTPHVLGMNEPLANGTGVEVVGYGFARNGAERATLWTPR